MNTSAVSVIITCYNQAHFLAEAIESVLAQTHKGFEVIVIDDGSKDQPQRIAANYPEVRLVRQENQGVSAARNKGWSASKSDFVVFLDADDRLLPSALKAGLSCFQQHPNCAFVFGQGRLIDSVGQPLPDGVQVPAKSWRYEDFLAANPMAFPAVAMHRRTALEGINGFNSHVKGAYMGDVADYDLYLRLSRCYPVWSHNELVAEWRQHGTNTSRKSLLMLRSCIRILEAQRELVKGNEAAGAALERGLKKVATHYGEQLIEELRSDAKAGAFKWSQFVPSIMTLLRYYPQGLLNNAYRKIRVTVFGDRRV
jgi:glycosyltransferase involved in cell wall biosynthesis